MPPAPRRKISLIMPARNEGAMVRRTIESLLANTLYPDYETLVLDDASEDGCCDFLEAPPYRGDPRVRLVRAPGIQNSVALRIEGARQARGDVFMFLDAHLCFSPYWLGNLHDALARENYRGIVGPVVSALDAERWAPTTTLSYGWTTSADMTRIGHIGRGDVGPGARVPWLGATQIMIARETYEEIGGLCPLYRTYGNYDRDLCLRAYLLGHDCRIEPTAVIGHFFKREFRRPIGWADVAHNYFLLVYLNLGAKALARLAPLQTHGREEGMALFEAGRAEIDRWRARVERGQTRSPESYFERLVPC